jgi:ABC-type phosphate/phosphonate transport system, ATPase component
MTRAQLWLLDEPLSALDPVKSRAALATVLSAAQAANATLVVSLHQVDLALAHFPRIIGLRDGRVVFDVRREDLRDNQVAALYNGETVAPDESADPWPEESLIPVSGCR